MDIHPTTHTLLHALLKRQSVTPDNTDCLGLIKELLIKNNFECKIIEFDGINNLWAVHRPERDELPLLVLGGHTDVVPAGEGWASDPFEPTKREGKLFARGAADMKTGVVTMIQAAFRFIERHPDYPGRIAVMLTADEEGPAINGIRKLMPHLSGQGIEIDYALFTEPTSVEVLGDTIKRGRRGSLHGELTINGVQGHVAYPHQAANPIHVIANIISELTQQSWCDGSRAFPITTFQCSKIRAGLNATNVIPSIATVNFNFRYSTEVTAQILEKRVKKIVQRNVAEQSTDTLLFDYHLEWVNSADPFITPKGEVVTAMVRACKDVLDITPELSTSGGTSDARFLAPYGTQVIEFGVINKTIHQINENVNLDDISRVEDTYLRFYEYLFLVN